MNPFRLSPRSRTARVHAELLSCGVWSRRDFDLANREAGLTKADFDTLAAEMKVRAIAAFSLSMVLLVAGVVGVILLGGCS